MVKFTKNARANYAFLLKKVFFNASVSLYWIDYYNLTSSYHSISGQFGIGDGPNA